MDFNGAEDSISEDDDDEEEESEEEKNDASSVLFVNHHQDIPTVAQQNLVVASTPWPPAATAAAAPPTTVYQILSASPMYNVLHPLQAATSPVVYLAGANHLQIQPQNVQLQQHQNSQQQTHQGMQFQSHEVQLQPQGVIITPVYNISGHTTAPIVYLPNNQLQPGSAISSDGKDEINKDVVVVVDDDDEDDDCRKDNLIASCEDDTGFHERSKFSFSENKNESEILCDQDTNDIFKLLDSNDNLDVCFEDLQSSLKLFMEDHDPFELSAKGNEQKHGDDDDESSSDCEEEGASDDGEEETAETENVRDIIEIIPLGQDYHPSNVIELIPEVHLKEIAAGGNIFENDNSNGNHFVIPYTNYGELTIGSTTITKIPRSDEKSFEESDKTIEQRMTEMRKPRESPAEKRARIKKLHDDEPPEKRKQRLRHLAKLTRERRSKETEEERRFRLDRNSRQKKEKRRQTKSQYVFHVQLLPNGKYVTTCIPKNNQNI